LLIRPALNLDANLTSTDVMGRLCAIGIALVAVLVGAGAVRADNAQVLPCRPTVTCTADLAPPGTLELELGYQARWPSAGATQQTTPILAKLPILRWLELQLGTNGLTLAGSARYIDNAVAGAKLHVLDQTATLPSIAVTASVSVPTVAQRGYVRAYDGAVVVHASKDVGHVHLDVNLGLIADDLGGARAYQPWAAVAATYPLTSRISIALEPHYFADASPVAPRDAGAIVAVEVAVRGWLVLDGAIDAVGLEPRSLAALVGVSIAPARLWGAHE
jgi:hypothetical protein